MTRSASSLWTATLTLTALAAVLLGIAPSPALASSTDCASAVVDESFRLPDGSSHPAGRLTLCRGSDFTPVTALYRTFVDRMPVGTFSGKRIGAVDADAHYMMFERDSGGVLHLAGYTLPTDRGAETFMLKRPGRVRVRHVVDSATPSALAPNLVRIATALD